jgi:hypothetical protein
MSRRHTAPIAVFAYRRPELLLRTLEALSANRLAQDSELHIFCDGARTTRPDELNDIRRVREIARAKPWCGQTLVHDSHQNLGLAASIRGGIDSMFVMHNRVIVVEDDIETSPGFLEYMNDALDLYESDRSLMHISGYLPSTSYRGILPSTFRTTHMNCWGWATWRDRWAAARWDAKAILADLDSRPRARRAFDLGGAARFSGQLEDNLSGKLSTWAAFWAASIFLAGGDCLMPGVSLVRNTGTNANGEHFHSDQTDLYDTPVGDSVSIKLKSGRSAAGEFYLRAFYRYGRDSRITTRTKRSLGSAKHRIAERLGLI